MSERHDPERHDPERRDPGRRDPIKVMVVDDHPMWRDAVARDLAESGFDVVATASDGDQAVRRARAAARKMKTNDKILSHKLK